MIRGGLPVNWGMSQKYFRSGVGFLLSLMEVLTHNLIERSYASLLASKTQLPFAALAFSSVVAMIPGAYLFRMADYLFSLYQLGVDAPSQVSFLALNQGVTAMMIVLAISLEVVFPKLCIDHFLDKKN